MIGTPKYIAIIPIGVQYAAIWRSFKISGSNSQTTPNIPDKSAQIACPSADTIVKNTTILLYC